MRVIIAGCRDWSASINRISEVVDESGFEVTEVVSGKAPGIDTSGEAWAEAHGIPVSEFPAFWEKYGRAAGPKRNEQMAEFADALIAFWDGKSKGTLNMITQMRALNKPYIVVALSDAKLIDTFKGKK